MNRSLKPHWWPFDPWSYCAVILGSQTREGWHTFYRLHRDGLRRLQRIQAARRRVSR